MASTAAQLIQRTRRFVGDYPEFDTLAASLANTGTTVTVSASPASSTYGVNWLIQIDSEPMIVRTSSSVANTITVFRPARGGTAASHANSATVLVRPAFTDLEYIDAFNSGINDAFPLFYQAVMDTSITTVSQTWEYTVPSVNGSPIPYVWRVSLKETGDLVYRPKQDWRVIRGSTPFIQFRRDEPSGTLRIEGFAPLPSLTDSTSSLSTLWPAHGEDYLVYYAANHLLMSGEARRARVDVGARDDRENANRPGTSMAAANSLYQRARQRLADAAMPPLPKHVVSVF